MGPQRLSSPNAATRAEQTVMPVEQGGTSATTVPEIREVLDVPSLSGTNLFTGANTFSSGLVASGGLTVENGIGISGDTAAANVSAADVSVLALSINHDGIGFTGNLALSGNVCLRNLESGNSTVTLPTAVGAAGRVYILKNSGAGTITLATTSSQTIDGAAPGTIAAGAGNIFVSTGANWITVKV